MIRFLVKLGIVLAATATIGLFLFSWHFYDVNPLDVGSYLGARVGSVGTEMEVAENPYNTLAQQLREREEELDEREEVLLKTLEERNDENRWMSNLIMGSITLLFILILFNFYLDYRTRQEERRQLA